MYNSSRFPRTRPRFVGAGAARICAKSSGDDGISRGSTVGAKFSNDENLRSLRDKKIRFERNFSFRAKKNERLSRGF